MISRYRLCHWLACAGLLILACPSFGQQPAEPVNAKTPASPAYSRLWVALRDDAKRYADDSVALVIAPLSWKRQDAQKQSR